MSDGSFSLSTPAELLLALGVAEALAESEEPTCQKYGDIFFGRIKSKKADGDIGAANAWRLLYQLTQIGMWEDNPEEPFQGRSLLPSDLDQVTAEAVHQLGLSTEDPELKSRLLDITWVRLRNPDAAREAVRSYLGAANRLFDPDDWIDYAQRIERALRLALQLRDRDLVDAVLADMERKVIELDGTDPSFMTARLMELLDEFKRGDPKEMNRIARKAAALAEEENAFERSRSHLENLRRWQRTAGDLEGEKEARIAIAASYVKQADLLPSGEAELLRAKLLEQGHQAYRNIGGMRATADEVYSSLRIAQRRARETLQEIGTDSIDVSTTIQAARDHVAGKPFKQALLALATVTRPTDFERESATARDLMEKYPLQGLMGGVKIDDDGRIVAHKTVALGGDEAQFGQALWQRVIEQVTLSYQLTAQAQIVPALHQLTFEHSPSLRDLQELVIDNPCVPEGHEELFAKGFLAGLRRNFPEALSLLVPQVESSLRNLLESAGFEVTTRDKHGLQSVITIGTILSDRKEELEQILDSNLIKELRLLFSDQHGPDLRNSIAHGLMTHDDFFSSNAVYAWWFILFICIVPVRSRFRPATKQEVEEAGDKSVPAQASPSKE